MGDDIGRLGADDFSANALAAPSIVYCEHRSVSYKHNTIIKLLLGSSVPPHLLSHHFMNVHFSRRNAPVTFGTSIVSVTCLVAYLLTYYYYY